MWWHNTRALGDVINKVLANSLKYLCVIMQLHKVESNKCPNTKVPQLLALYGIMQWSSQKQ